MRVDAGSTRAARLAASLRDVASSLIATIAETQPDDWLRPAGTSAWAIGKDAEHVIEAAGYHQWIVRRTIGDKVSSRPPVLERQQMTTELSIREAIDRIQGRTEDAAALLSGLTDEQLDLPTRPPRARSQRLAQTIEAVLIGHYAAHQRDIEAKQRALAMHEWLGAPAT